MQKYLFYNKAELNRVNELVTPVIQHFISDWFNDDGVDATDIQVTNYEQSSFPNEVYYDSGNIIGVSLHSSKSDLLKSTIGGLDLLSERLSTAFVNQLFDSLLSALTSSFSSSLPLNAFPETNGMQNFKNTHAGIVQINLTHAFFELSIFICPKALRKPVVLDTLPALNRQVMVNDAVCDLLFSMGQTTLSVEDVALLEVGDVLKLDQRLDEKIKVTTSAGDHLAFGELGRVNNKLAVKLSISNN